MLRSLSSASTLCFNPRAREGRDHNVGSSSLHSICFNPRAREGRDLRDAGSTGQQEVSIHAPARGATYQRRRPVHLGEFQSTRPRGARRPKLPSSTPASTFQSTRPRGARRARPGRCSRAEKFQSTRPRGARHAISSGDCVSLLFQSTRPRGARPSYLVSNWCLRSVSIHAPARGATCV